jgi:hypothetical protein
MNSKVLRFGVVAVLFLVVLAFLFSQFTNQICEGSKCETQTQMLMEFDEESDMTVYVMRNFTEVCGEVSEDIMIECSARYLPPMPETAPSYVGQQCKLALENNASSFDTNGFAFWEGMDLNRARSVKGDVTMLQNALKKAQQGKCLKIAVVGGSHCAGGCTPNPSVDNFGTFLARYLNERFPGNGCNHTTTGAQFCSHGTPSTTHAFHTRSQIEKTKPADIALLEFGNNDYQYSAQDSTNMFRNGWSLEYIYLKWREAGVAVMFVESSFRIDWDSRRQMFSAWNAESLHLEFLNEYHVPTVSFSKAVLPEFWEQRFNASSKFDETKIFGDYRVHMIPRGHAILAAMILMTFENILNDSTDVFEVPSELRFIPELYYKRLEEDTIFQVNFNERFFFGQPNDDALFSGKGRINFTSEWKLTDEGRRDKWGLLSTSPGSVVTVQIPEAAHTLYLTLLKSYENMGVVQVSLENCTASESTPKPQEVDCQWQERSSQNYIFSMDFNKSICEVLKISVIPTDRPISKIKLVSLSFT